MTVEQDNPHVDIAAENHNLQKAKLKRLYESSKDEHHKYRPEVLLNLIAQEYNLSENEVSRVQDVLFNNNLAPYAYPGALELVHTLAEDPHASLVIWTSGDPDYQRQKVVALLGDIPPHNIDIQAHENKVVILPELIHRYQESFPECEVVFVDNREDMASGAFQQSIPHALTRKITINTGDKYTNKNVSQQQQKHLSASQTIYDSSSQDDKNRIYNDRAELHLSQQVNAFTDVVADYEKTRLQNQQKHIVYCIDFDGTLADTAHFLDNSFEKIITIIESGASPYHKESNMPISSGSSGS